MNRLLLRNSWGRALDQNDYCTMPYAYLTNGNLVGDMWTMRKLGGQHPTPTDYIQLPKDHAN